MGIKSDARMVAITAERYEAELARYRAAVADLAVALSVARRALEMAHRRVSAKVATEALNLHADLIAECQKERGDG